MSELSNKQQSLTQLVERTTGQINCGPIVSRPGSKIQGPTIQALDRLLIGSQELDVLEELNTKQTYLAAGSNISIIRGDSVDTISSSVGTIEISNENGLETTLSYSVLNTPSFGVVDFNNTIQGRFKTKSTAKDSNNNVYILSLLNTSSGSLWDFGDIPPLRTDINTTTANGIISKFDSNGNYRSTFKIGTFNDLSTMKIDSLNNFMILSLDTSNLKKEVKF